MSKVIVFAGPSISRSRIESNPGFEWRPPVSQGDVYLAEKSRPYVIAIVDGFFEGVPSVWHKEILWAMSRGVHVFGASSMGALRAAELHSFGMRGIGEVFRKYRDGIYEDDDEVAVRHGPAELEFLPVNVPMVNVRFTVESAINDDVLSRKEADCLLRSAKSMFYPNRQRKSILSSAKNEGLQQPIVEEFEQWLKVGERDIKRQDAEQLLKELQTFIQQGDQHKDVDFHFEWTVMWDRAVAESGGNDSDNLDRDVVDELRMQPEFYNQVAMRTQLKQLALQEAERKRVTPNIEQTRKQLGQLRERLGLFSRAQLDDWMRTNDITDGELQSMLEDQQKQHEIIDRLGEISNSMLLSELRLLNNYEQFKHQAVTTRELNASAEFSEELKPAQLLAWYFETHRGQHIPENVDEYISSLGLRNRDDLYRLLKKQYVAALAKRTERQ